LFFVPALGLKDQAKPKDAVNVAFSFGAPWLEVYQSMENMLLAAVRESGSRINIQFWYANGDADREASNIRRAIASGPDVLVLMPLNSQSVLSHIESAQRKGIAVIVYNRQQDAHETIRANAYIGLDTFDQAYTTAVALFKLMRQDESGMRVSIILGDMADRNAINRRKGFLRAAEEMGAIVVSEIESDWDAKKAARGLEQELNRDPRIDALLLSSDFMIDEIKNILQAKNRWAPYGERNHMYIGSQDAFSHAIPLIKAGYIDVATAFDIWPMSTTLVQVINTLSSKIELRQDVFLIPGRIVTRNNISGMEDLWSLDKK
jgi:ABC-type sugar transport system substrate-binding protein